jgi:hypothetical protein
MAHLLVLVDGAFGALAPFLLAKNASAESFPGPSTGDSLGIFSGGPLVWLLSQPASGEPQTMAAPRNQGNERNNRVRFVKIASF